MKQIYIPDIKDIFSEYIIQSKNAFHDLKMFPN